MIETDIYAGLFVAIEAFADARSIPVAFPGRSFTPPTGGGKYWLEVAVFPNATLPYAWSDEGPNEYRGFVQVGVVQRPNNVGVFGVLNLAAALIEALPKGFVAGPATLTEEASMSSVLIADDRITVPCSFYYRALTSR